jgi:RNA polymerase sigma factor (sigma-70 family)
MSAPDRESGTVVCLVGAGVDETAVAALEQRFAPRVQVVRERRRSERRGAERRHDEPGFLSARDRRRVRNPGGRRVDERRRVLEVRGIPRLPAPARSVSDRVAFLRAAPGDCRRREAAESLRLVVRFQLGDPHAFKTLYERHFDAVYAYLLTVLRDRHEAEDSAQEAFTKILHALPRFEFRRGRFEAWLFRIVRNHALNVKRRTGPVSPADPARIDLWRERRDSASTPHGPDDDLRALIDRLPTAQRQVIVLRYMVELEWDEIAGLLDRSSGAVRQLEQRALVHLRRRLAAGSAISASRARPMPMRRRCRQSPVVAMRRRALLAGRAGGLSPASAAP